MGEQTEIAWATSTFSPWWGCTNVSPACDHCYAETLAKRWGFDVWGRDSPRRWMSEHQWNEPLRWERKAAKTGEPWRVFCGSMCDVFEDWKPPEPTTFEEIPAATLDSQRARLWALIERTPHLTWMMLTKRPENVLRMVPSTWSGTEAGAGWAVLDDVLVDLARRARTGWPGNVWVGTTVENQRYADLRVPKLLGVPAPVRFVSCEPLLGPVDLGRFLPDPLGDRYDTLAYGRPRRQSLKWVIVGGESGAHARPMHPAWARSLRDQCQAAGVPFHFKQWGEFGPAGSWRGPDHHVTIDGRLFQPGERLGADHLSTPAALHRWGKKGAGRELDGRTWDEFPS